MKLYCQSQRKHQKTITMYNFAHSMKFFAILKMKLVVTILLMLPFGVVNLIGQSVPERAAEARGRTILEATRNKLKTFQALRFHFTYTMENTQQNITETLKGEFLVQGDRYFMTLGNNRFISDGITTWSYMAELNEVYINLLANDQETLTPTSILNDFEEKFRARHVRQETQNGRRVEIIDLTPIGAHLFFKYRVAIDSNTGMVVSTTAHDREGGTFTYRIDRVETNPRIPQGTFRFNAQEFPGIEVVDLR